MDDAAFLEQCRLEMFRGSGPGGQKRNKTSSAVRLTHQPTGLSASATEMRSQAQNRARALRRLRRLVILSLRQPLDLANYRPPAVLAGHLAAGRLDLPPGNAQFLPVLGAVLDLLAACGWSVSDTATRLGISTANLVSFLQQDRATWSAINTARDRAGLKPLRAG